MTNKTLKDKLQEGVLDLKSVRDQVVRDLHSATNELRTEWAELEKRIDHAKDATNDAADKLFSQLRSFRDRLRSGPHADTVADVMTRILITCLPTDTLSKAVVLMFEHDIGAVVVVNADRRLQGILTDRDAAIASCTQGKRMNELSVASAMSSTVVWCRPEDSLETALGLMESHKVHRIPVVAGDEAVQGVITLNDAAHALVKPGEQGASATYLIAKAVLALGEKRKQHSQEVGM